MAPAAQRLLESGAGAMLGFGLATIVGAGAAAPRRGVRHGRCHVAHGRERSALSCVPILTSALSGPAIIAHHFPRRNPCRSLSLKAMLNRPLAAPIGPAIKPSPITRATLPGCRR